MATKPNKHIEWGVGNPDPANRIVEPSDAKKEAAWLDDERPPAPFFNWLFNVTDAWNKWAEAQIAENSPITTRGDIIVKDATDTTVRLPLGAEGEVLRPDAAGDIVWEAGLATAAKAGQVKDPLTTRGDILTRNASNVAGRVALGSEGQVLRPNASGDPVWEAGLATAAKAGQTKDPLTTRGDLLTRNASNVAGRLAIGTDGQTLGANASGDPVWGAGPVTLFEEVAVSGISGTGNNIMFTGLTIGKTYKASVTIRATAINGIAQTYIDVGIKNSVSTDNPVLGIYYLKTLTATSTYTASSIIERHRTIIFVAVDANINGLVNVFTGVTGGYINILLEELPNHLVTTALS